jgi:hypothetical protein
MYQAPTTREFNCPSAFKSSRWAQIGNFPRHVPTWHDTPNFDRLLQVLPLPLPYLNKYRYLRSTTIRRGKERRYYEDITYPALLGVQTIAQIALCYLQHRKLSESSETYPIFLSLYSSVPQYLAAGCLWGQAGG